MSRRVAKRVGQRIRWRRLDLGYTQAALAERAGLSLVHVNRIEKGLPNVGLEVMKRIAAALDMPLGQLVGGPPRKMSPRALAFAQEFDEADPEIAAAIMLILAGLPRKRGRS